MTETRAQHYIPRFILQNFTLSGSAEDQLWVTAPVDRKQWRSRPGETGHRRDFYRVQTEGVDPNVAETFLSNLESDAAPIFREMIRSEHVPEGQDEREVLLYFLAFWLARVPSPREALDRSLEALHKQALRTLLETPERWSEYLEARRREGVLMPENQIDYDSMKEFIDSDDFSVRLESNGFHVKMMFQSAGFVRPLLAQRQWGLHLSRSGEFICSDRAALFVESLQPDHPPGLGFKDTGVLFPVSRHLMLVGSQSESTEVFELNKKEVAQTNRLTLVNTHRYVFSANSEFPWLDRSGRVRYDMPPMAKDDSPALIEAYVKGSTVPEKVVELRERPLTLLE